jgi:hypothetical protein
MTPLPAARLSALLLTIAGSGIDTLSAKAVDVNRMPPPPASPVERHDPDLRTCTSDNLLQAWQQQLQAYSDPPRAVLERLRLVQRDLAIVTINRCIQRGLLSRGDARQLAIQMGLETGTPTPTTPQGQTPAAVTPEPQAPNQRP